jgi:2-polyprenyl-3-methyl-5-hydroxy-6-metoxy-1,4-benzoquinol methylase
VSESDTDQAGAQAAFFERLAPDWSQTHYGPQGGMRPRIARFAAALEALVPLGASILDFGCGTGDIAVALAARGYRVEGRDTSAKMIETATALHGGTNVRFAVIAPAGPGANGEHALGGHGFDAVLCSSVLEYVPDAEATLRSLANSLNPGGWLLATVPNIEHRARRGEARNRMLMKFRLARALVQLTPWAETFELQWHSRNRYPVSHWAGMFEAAGLKPTWQDCEDHPLSLLVGRRVVDAG